MRKPVQDSLFRIGIDDGQIRNHVPVCVCVHIAFRSFVIAVICVHVCA